MEDNKGKKRYSLRRKMIQYNLTVTLISLILCGVIFVASVSIIVGDYIHSDINFFLSAMSETMESKLSYCGDTITRLRGSTLLMDYLENTGERRTEEDEEYVRQIRAEFDKQVSISSQSSLGAGVPPLIRQVYLFDQEGQHLSSSYYAMMYAEIAGSDKTFEGIYRQYLQDIRKGNHYGYYPEGEDSIFLAFPVYDDGMERQGSILFQLDQSAIEYIMQDMGKYGNSFWAFFDAEGNYVYGKDADAILKEKETILYTFKTEPYKAKAGGSSYRIFKKELGLNLQVVLGIPENQSLILMYNSVKVYVIVIALITGAACLIFVYMIYRMTRPLKEVTDKLLEVKEGKFEAKLPDYGSEEFHEISQVFNDMTAYIDHLVKQVYEKQLSIKDMEMKFLQTQMNPHFMFNVLNTIALQAQMDGNTDVYKMISSFSQLIQAKIYRNSSEKVQIRQELEYVNYYLYLQSYRYGDRLEYEIKVEDPTLAELYIPKLCIQLIVENAVVHGIEPKTENGKVEVHIYAEDESLYIDTTDNGIGFESEGIISLPISQEGESKSHNHVGLNNAHHIIRLMYGEEYGIRIYSKPGEGTRVSICIPFDDGQDRRESPCTE
ncbi:sensor histidine kinase [Faecalicatena orotica]|uniref:Histidine kinase/DNA gyrase B/HSP90-like ATPase n=1 Tax=Faecalicatena orotica TaxID=1544 RepID=A0A2Y9BAV6_9FIRM|nr:histidine kinase [Faecalicatena orotica]PWJ30860.1 histidine kinase/DNA gyrase B/HSP90-like ATPase [Faecalicatena orotica]SSA55021.1 Histidine kinase-, DNA gyrase B-, and HSP90-like ATPase [Faecalicatena orotica]